MKLLTIILILVMLIIPFQSASAKGINRNVITLTASDVDSADDIEAAIINVTENGTRPGTVILDGKNGPFVFTGDDRSLNIFVSSLTLRGVNQAWIENCDDGLFFDDFPLRHILVERISFFCTGDGLEATGSFQDVILRNNVFSVGINGIGVGGHSSNWNVKGNMIQAGGDGIVMTGVEGVVITQNHLSARDGIVLLTSSQSQIHRNTIEASFQGILLGQESWENIVQANTILGVSAAGIMLNPGVVNNRILANRVMCAQGTFCLTVDALPEVAEVNKIAGNKP